MKHNTAGTERKMQDCLNRLGIPLKVLWIPKMQTSKHGEILSNCLFIYDTDTSEAWTTFEHEAYEFKFREVTYTYRTLVNSLVEGFEKMAYERKERFLEFLPRMSRVIAELESAERRA